MQTFRAILFCLMSWAILAQGNPVRSGSGDGTYYAPGLGACGKWNSGSDMIMAASREVFDTFPGATANPNKNPICGREVTATYQGKTIKVKVVDRCAGCKWGDIDLSPTAFSKLAPLSVGRLKGVRWSMN
ncbi:RlpA-like double-psi beta-barrel-protein domain-containing protein-containing protein [Cristinia sonorae]|uniref:RlpA-like double-psi beta-barrel-protein domain-containing protein-containing protein n=1 Tax=Cristinia sonorae TaxID=1940300 RepID=A0A8K0UH53_9AGAR|nr:RlpA-like double-psi beta-barrel-protein domain-containing protein-containing protein [Cristinia sonorae]